MKKIIKIYKDGNKVTTNNHHLFTSVKVENQEVQSFLDAKAEYKKFCENQTKRGQARKNERARFRKNIFKGLEAQQQRYNEIFEENLNELTNEQDFILKEINIDGRLGVNGRRFQIEQYLRLNRRELLNQF